MTLGGTRFLGERISKAEYLLKLGDFTSRCGRNPIRRNCSEGCAGQSVEYGRSYLAYPQDSLVMRSRSQMIVGTRIDAHGLGGF